MAAVASPHATILQDGPPNGSLPAGLQQLRQVILYDGIPSTADGMSDLRIYIWLVLLGAPPMPHEHYLDIVRQGPSPSYEKIRNDTFRTLASDPLFRRKVTENSLTRVLNAVSWKLHDENEARVNGWQSPPILGPKPPLSFNGSITGSPDLARQDGELEPSAINIHNDTAAAYVQGMNVLAAPFLYASRSEVQAFTAYNRLINAYCPAYVRSGSMDGVHRGVALVDKILAVVDPDLSAYLMSKSMSAEIYAFASVLTLCACTPPLPEVLVLWDFLFAFGPHLNLLCVVAQLVLIRDQLLASPSPNQILRSLPPLQATPIKSLALSFVNKISDDLFADITNHAQ